MFHDAAFVKNDEYGQSKADYLKKLQELEAFIQDREKLVSKKPVVEEYREWTDATGKYRVVARLVSVTETSVTLEKKNAKTVSVPLAKLSQKDRTYVQSHER